MQRPKTLALDNFFRQNFIFFIGSMLAAFFNYLFHPILGRIMGVEEFGEVQFFLSFYGQFAVLVTVFSMVAINIYANNKEIDKGIVKLQELKNIFIYFFVFLFVLLGVLSLAFRSFGHFNPIVLVLTLLLLLLGVSTNFRTSYLQARKKFLSLSWMSIVNSFVRLLAAVLLVVAGLSEDGAILGIILSQALALYLAYELTKGNLMRHSDLSLKFGKNVLAELLYGLVIFISMGAVVFFATSDIIFVKFFFSDLEAGTYSGVATVARIIYFAAGSVSGVLLVNVKMEESPAANLRILGKSFAFLGFLTLPVFAAFNFFPDQVVSILIGQKYSALAALLPKLSLLMLVASSLSLLVFYNIALRRKMLILVSVIPFVISMALIILFHAQPENIINDLTIGALIMNILLLINEKRNFRHHSRA